MPRRSTRISASASASASAAQTKKRPLVTSTASTPNTVKRQKSTNNLRARGKGRNSSSTKSKYFNAKAEDEASDNSSSDLSSKLSEPEPSDDFSAYGGDGEPGLDEEPVFDEGGSTDNGVGGQESPSAAGGNKRKKWKASETTKGKELWREGIRAGLGPGKEVFIELPKARDPGGISYEDHTIHPNTMLFLRDLNENNNREWFKMHDTDYRAAKKDWETFVESFSEKISEKDNTIPELPAKDLVFRVHRDIRFSKDQTPYKHGKMRACPSDSGWSMTADAEYRSRTGRKGKYAAYYLHLQPGHCFLAAGVWMPEEPRLSQLRMDVDRNPERIRRALNNEDIRREFLDGIPSDGKRAVMGFVSQNQEGALKTKPKGYSADHRDIELLRLRNYTLSKKLRDEDVLGADARDRLALLIGILVPFVTWINSVVMPDDDDEAEGNSDQDEDET